jgi:hypothetical protein
MRSLSIRSAFHSHEPVNEVQHFAASAHPPGQSGAGCDRLGDATGWRRWSARAATGRTWLVHTLVSAAALLLILVPASVAGQEIWFGPRSPGNVPFAPVLDWDMVLHPNPEWDQLAGQIQIFFTSDGLPRLASDDDLRALASGLAKHHVGLGVEIGSITARPGEECARREGYYTNPHNIPDVVHNLTRLGIPLAAVQLDGPLWSGHYQGCKLPIPELAVRVAETLRPMLQAFPDLEVGDVESVQGLSQFPDWRSNYVEFKHDVEQAMGHKLSFLHTDINWLAPDWPTVLTATADLAHSVGERFGVIYNGDGTAPTDEIWVAEAKRHFDELETRYGVIPDDPIFETWIDHPRRIFPASSPASHSYLVAQYELPRTHLTATRVAAGVQGRLTQANGRPVSGAQIVIEALGDDPQSPPPMRSSSGTVPPQARFAVLAMRVNSECSCSGPNDIVFGPLTYQETAGGSVHYEYRPEAAPRQATGVAATPIAVANRTLMHVKVAPTGNYVFNSAVFPVTQGAQFQFRVPLASLNGNGLFGTVAVVWLNAQQQGVQRTNITVGNDATPVTTAVTDATGSYATAIPKDAHWQQRPLLLHYAGSPTLRAAYASPP